MSKENITFNLQARIARQNENRPAFASSKEDLENMFFAEVEELNEIIDEFYLTEMPDFHMVSEVGDIAYLWLRYRQLFGQPPEHMTEQLIRVQNLASLCHFTLSDAVEMKLYRNSGKHIDAFYDGTDEYKAGVKKAKAYWEAMGGDKVFFKYYSEIDNERVDN